MLVQDFGDEVGAVAGAICGAIVIAVIEKDDGKGAISRRNLQDARDGQAVAGIR